MLEDFGPLVTQAIRDAGLTVDQIAIQSTNFFNYRGHRIEIPSHWLTIKQARMTTIIEIMMCPYLRGPVQLFLTSMTVRGAELGRHDYLGLDESVDAILVRVKAFEQEIIEAKKLGIGRE